jgi:hypothetical protein
MTIESITQDYVKQLFEYRDGNLYWKVKPRQNVKIGAKAGTLNNIGYFLTKINNKNYLNHRLIFLMHHGYLPKYLDHIDGSPSNNKLENLRPATFFENNWNAKLSKKNTSGVKGVNWHKDMKKWQIRIKTNGKRKSFGLYDDLELAELVAQEARTKYHGAFANHG